jgi:hypothetical protein
VLRARLRAAVAPHADDPEAAAHAHADAILRFAEEQTLLARLAFATDLADRSLGTALLDRLAETQEKRLREGMADGEFRRDLDVAVIAQALVGMQARVVVWWLADGKRTPRAVVVDSLAKLRLTGLQPPHSKGIPR